MLRLALSSILVLLGACGGGHSGGGAGACVPRTDGCMCNDGYEPMFCGDLGDPACVSVCNGHGGVAGTVDFGPACESSTDCTGGLVCSYDTSCATQTCHQPCDVDAGACATGTCSTVNALGPDGSSTLARVCVHDGC